ncbi:hypothetical protein ES703_38934 [subsurface metagenome]
MAIRNSPQPNCCKVFSPTSVAHKVRVDHCQNITAKMTATSISRRTGGRVIKWNSPLPPDLLSGFPLDLPLIFFLAISLFGKPKCRYILLGK